MFVKIRSHKLTHMFYVIAILMIFHFSFSPVNCDNASTSTIEMPTTELMTNRIGETVGKMDTKQFSMQPRFISMFRTVSNGFIFFIKGIVQFYNWYTPELELGRCVINFAPTFYPELAKLQLSYQDILKYLRTFFLAINGFLMEMINDSQQDIGIEQQRISDKIVDMLIPLSTTPTTKTSSVSSSRPMNHVQSPYPNYNDQRFDYMENKRPLFTNHRHLEKSHLKPNISLIQSYENQLKKAQSYNDFFPTTKGIDLYQFDKKNFHTNAINRNKFQSNNSFSLETKIPVDLEKLERKYSNNYNMSTVDYSPPSSSASSSSVIQSARTTTNILDDPDTDENKKFFQTSSMLEDNFNVNENYERDEKSKKFPVMYVGPRQFPTDYDDMSPPLDDVPTLELNKNSNSNDDGEGVIDSNISDFENVILESLGFNAKAVKSFPWSSCIRTYIIDLFRRTFEYFILM